MTLQVYLDQEIKKICPIHGISFGDLSDKSTWIFHFMDESTEDQKNAAINFIRSFEWTKELQKNHADQQKIEKYKNDLNMKAGYVGYLVSNPKASFLDYINYLESIQI